MALTRGQRREAIRSLHVLIAAVERGELAVDGPAANAMLRRLEGALLAMEALEDLRR